MKQVQPVIKTVTIRTHIIRKIFKSNRLLNPWSYFWSCNSNFRKKYFDLVLFLKISILAFFFFQNKTCLSERRTQSSSITRFILVLLIPYVQYFILSCLSDVLFCFCRFICKFITTHANLEYWIRFYANWNKKKANINHKYGDHQWRNITWFC